MKHLIKSIRYLLTMVYSDETEIIKSFETIDNARETIVYLTGIQLLNYMPTEIRGDSNGNAYFWDWGIIEGWKITLEKIEERECPHCHNAFTITDTEPDKKFCSAACRQDNHYGIKRDNEGNIIAGRQRAAYRKGQTIDFSSCVETTLRSINNDVVLLASIEHTSTVTAIFESSIVFVDDSGNQYEYDGVSISEGKLKVSIKKV